MLRTGYLPTPSRRNTIPHKVTCEWPRACAERYGYSRHACWVGECLQPHAQESPQPGNAFEVRTGCYIWSALAEGILVRQKCLGAVCPANHFRQIQLPCKDWQPTILMPPGALNQAHIICLKYRRVVHCFIVSKPGLSNTQDRTNQPSAHVHISELALVLLLMLKVELYLSPLFRHIMKFMHWQPIAILSPFTSMQSYGARGHCSASICQ